MIKKTLVSFLLIIFGIINQSSAKDKKLLITVNQFINHIALDAAENGLREALTDRKILPDKADIIISNAQGNITNSVQISKHHASLAPEFMVAISTPSAQTNLKAKNKDSILAFVAVTDPEAANLLGQNNVIGVSDNPPIEELMILVQKIFPDITKIGVIYNAGEINSMKMTTNLEELVKSKGIQVKKVSITTSNDVKIAMQKLLGEVDLIYLPQDNSVISALDNIISLSRSAKIPLIANDPTLVSKGVFMALGANYFKSGEQLGHMIASLIEDNKINLEIQETSVKELKINKKIAQEFNITIPSDIKAGEQK